MSLKGSRAKPWSESAMDRYGEAADAMPLDAVLFESSI